MPAPQKGMADQAGWKPAPQWATLSSWAKRESLAFRCDDCGVGILPALQRCSGGRGIEAAVVARENRWA